MPTRTKTMLRSLLGSDLTMTERKVSFVRDNKDHGHGKNCVEVSNASTIILEGRPDMKTFNFDFVGGEELD